jgi:hypothetical protein
MNAISPATGRRIIAAGKIRITRISHRILIGIDDNARFQAAARS